MCVCQWFIVLYVYQVSASLDALIELSGGKVNIHVLMAMAAFATIFMGNALEGGLLLAMFNLAHIGKFVLFVQTHYGCIWINNLLHVLIMLDINVVKPNLFLPLVIIKTNEGSII